MNTNQRQTILITDDSSMNREILSDILKEEYNILEAADGEEAISILEESVNQIDLVLLDIVMPKMDGFEVLALMNKHHWIDDTPVMMISAETVPSSMHRAYELGAVDFIRRPFDEVVVHKRVSNTMMLYARQKRLIGMVTEQIYEKEKSSNLMVTILSHIVEFRNGESGLHVLHINTMTKILLQELKKKTDRYPLTQKDISLISMASSLHDIGKIAIPDEILNKPGRLTPEEFEIMKKHSSIGAEMLKDLPFRNEDGLVKVAYEICRWHHERFDGRGYPDGLVGDEIPISAQVVSIADVYDALTSERVYKKAFSHEKAMEMILNGECGKFNPLLLECLQSCADVIQYELKNNSLGSTPLATDDIQNIVYEVSQNHDLASSNRAIALLEKERLKNQFYLSCCDDYLFEYSKETEILKLSKSGAARLGIGEITLKPFADNHLLKCIGAEQLSSITSKLDELKPKETLKLSVCFHHPEEDLPLTVLFQPLGVGDKRTGVLGKFKIEKKT